MEILCILNLALSIAIIAILIEKRRKKGIKTPLILMENSKINEEKMKTAKIDVEELMSRARLEGYFNIGDIDTAVLETNGEISFLPTPSKRRLSPRDFNFSPIREGISRIVIYKGRIIEGNLSLSGIKKEELEKLIDRRGSKLGEIFLATANEAGRIDFY